MKNISIGVCKRSLLQTQIGKALSRLHGGVQSNKSLPCLRTQSMKRLGYDVESRWKVVSLSLRKLSVSTKH